MSGIINIALSDKVEQKITLINIIGRVEETQDSHDLNAVTDESRRISLPGDPPLLTVLLSSEEIWRRVNQT